MLVMLSLFNLLIGLMGGATTFACKIQECPWQDWYIYVLFSPGFACYNFIIRASDDGQRYLC